MTPCRGLWVSRSCETCRNCTSLSFSLTVTRCFIVESTSDLLEALLDSFRDLGHLQQGQSEVRGALQQAREDGLRSRFHDEEQTVAILDDRIVERTLPQFFAGGPGASDDGGGHGAQGVRLMTPPKCVLDREPIPSGHRRGDPARDIAHPGQLLPQRLRKVDRGADDDGLWACFQMDRARNGHSLLLGPSPR